LLLALQFGKENFYKVWCLLQLHPGAQRLHEQNQN
jgi:hypothetical protein